MERNQIKKRRAEGAPLDPIDLSFKEMSEEALFAIKEELIILRRRVISQQYRIESQDQQIAKLTADKEEQYQLLLTARNKKIKEVTIDKNKKV